MNKLASTIFLFIVLFLAKEAWCQLAFVANVDGNWDLFIADENGKNPVRLTNTPYDEKQPRWSFDKKNIVYATSDGRVNVINIENKKIKHIPDKEIKTSAVTPCFAPDGKRIAFARFRPVGAGDDTDLMIWNLDTEKIVRILDQPSLQWWPTWSPDGRRIVYVNNHCSGECGRLIQELWIAKPEGGWARQLLLTSSLCQQPVWSYDGTKIGFSSDKAGNFDIWVLSLKDWRLQQITTYSGLDESPAWSPDGKKLAFISMRSGFMEIWIKNLQNGKIKRFRPFGAKQVACRDVAW